MGSVQCDPSRSSALCRNRRLGFAIALHRFFFFYSFFTIDLKALEAGEELDPDAAPESTKNQFNYSERAAQTFNNPMRERGVVTEPPPMLSFKNTVAQWEIYDSYMGEYSAQV